MIILTVAEIIQLHKKIIIATGGTQGIRDERLLESAVLGCYQTFGGEELYPTVIKKAARMSFAICKNHPFIDGNKRTAVTSMLVMLRMNNVALTYTQPELIELVLGIANGSIDYDSIVAWICVHQLNC
jgi:death-on-curing protein